MPPGYAMKNAVSPYNATTLFRLTQWNKGDMYKIAIRNNEGVAKEYSVATSSTSTIVAQKASVSQIYNNDKSNNSTVKFFHDGAYIYMQVIGRSAGNNIFAYGSDKILLEVSSIDLSTLTEIPITT